MSSTPPTTLAERIARLNKAPTASNSSYNPTTPSSTGATSSVSDKIKRFQTEDAPLVPVGSFGLGGVRREPSASGAGDKGRVASLGLGRANVPLGVVKAGPRSVSVGSDATRASPSKFTPPSSSGGNSTPPPAEEAVLIQPVEATSAPEHLDDDTEPTTPPLLPSQPPRSDNQTPVSISSTKTELGSLASESVYVTPTSTSTSSPVVGAVVGDMDDSASTISSTPSQPPSSFRTPVALLREPSRAFSSLSISSIAVEHGSAAGDDDSSTVLTECTEDLGEAKVVPTSLGLVSESDLTSAVEGEDEEEMEEKTNLELEQYEKEEHDRPKAPSDSILATATAPASALAETGSPAQAQEKELGPALPSEPVLIQVEDDSEAAYADILDDFTEDEPNSSTKTGPSGMPLVKCSDCNGEVDIMELADHSCVPTPSNSTSNKVLFSPPPRAPADVPVEVDQHSPPFSSSSPTHSIPTRTSPLDPRFDTVRRHSIPHDVDDDATADRWEPEDMPDSPLDPKAHFQSVFSEYNNSPPIDVPEDGSDDPLLEDILARASTKAAKEKSTRPTTKGMLDDDDEENHEQVDYGSVTIMRTTASHHKNA